MKVLNFGSLNIDYVYRVDHMIRPGETMSTQSLEVFLGGKGFNQSVALAKAGAPVCHAGLIGEDGGAFLSSCKEYGIDAKWIRSVAGKSGHTIIQLDCQGQNCILLHGGSNQAINEAYIDEVLEDFVSGDFLVVQNEISGMPYLIDRAYRKGMQIVMNPSPFDETIQACNLEKVSYFLLNEIEGEQLTGETAPDRILDNILSQYPAAKVVLTLGQAGARYGAVNVRYSQGIRTIGETVDTTAAGDTFTGYFVAGILEGLSVPDNLKRCALASGIAVSRKGASPSIPWMSEVKELEGKSNL